MTVFDDRRCELGEGPFWHPERKQLFWFDILNARLLSRDGDRPLAWDLGELASAAGWLSDDELLVATATGLSRFDLRSGAREPVASFPEAPHLRSNDGRADPWGGFWIGTMGRKGETEAGSIWRLHQGELRELYPRITTPNAICFDPERERGFFADTKVYRVWSQRLDPGTGWPLGEPSVFLDLSDEGLSPDGAVIDAEGNLWSAQWGAGRVAAYAPDGRFLRAESFDASRTSCPAFGGDTLSTLYVTTAQEGMDAAARAAEPQAGKTFVREVGIKGVPEPRVVLG